MRNPLDQQMSGAATSVVAGSMSSSPGPSVESFALSSALLRDLVSSWVPTSFGVTKPAVEREKEFVAAMSKGGRRGAEWEAERLGLGHPLFEPGADRVAGPSTARRDFSTIAKHLAKPGAAGDDSGRAGKRAREDESDGEEETSRFRSVGKGKGKAEAAGVQALLSGKKKKKKAKKESRDAADETIKEHALEASRPDGEEEDEPRIASLAILKSGPPAASPSSSPEPETPSQGASQGKTKAARRREAKKRRREEKKRAGM